MSYYWVKAIFWKLRIGEKYNLYFYSFSRYQKFDTSNVRAPWSTNVFPVLASLALVSLIYLMGQFEGL